MKAKVIKNKRTNEMKVEYYRVEDKAAFRYNLLKNIFTDTNLKISAIIDTNQIIPSTDSQGRVIDDKPADYIEELLNENGITFRHFKTASNPTKFFGLSTDFIKKKKKKGERIYVIKLNNINFTNQLFSSLFCYYDTGYGLAENVNIDELTEALETENFSDVLFSETFFTKSIYDSIVCSSFRSSFDIAKYVKETKA